MSDPTMLRDAWIQAEKADSNQQIGNTVENVKSKLTAAGLAQQLTPEFVNSILTQRKNDLISSTKTGPLRIFPEEQWKKVMQGPGIDSPSPNLFSLMNYCVETVSDAQPLCGFSNFPTEEKETMSYFVYGDENVLVPRLANMQHAVVSNPFKANPSLPRAPVPLYLPNQAHILPPRTSTSPNLGNSNSQSNMQPPPYTYTNPQQANQQNFTNTNTDNYSQGGFNLPIAASAPNLLKPNLPPRGSVSPQNSPNNSNSNSPHGTNNPHGQPPPITHSHPPNPTDPKRRASITQSTPANPSAGYMNPNNVTNNQQSSSQPSYPPALPNRPSSQSDAAKKPYVSDHLSPSSSLSHSTPTSLPSISPSSTSSNTNISNQDASSSNSTSAVAPPRPPDPSQTRCPDELKGYCRSWNITHQKICPYQHQYWCEKYDPTGYSAKHAKFNTASLVPGSPEFDYIKIRFQNSWIHQSSKKPTVTKIKQVSCPFLEKMFTLRSEVIAASGVKPNITELYHGTCEANFETLFTQGFQPPADYSPNPQCPVSGPLADKLSTSLCKRTCKLCTSMPRHSWNVCHMWGLGIYCAIDSSKSDLYVSNKKGKKTDKTKRKMLLCSVILGEAENVKQLKTPKEMHDVVNVPVGKHSLFAVGWKDKVIPTMNGQTLGVMHDEYVVFHPHQIMPLYIIEYSK